MKRARNRVVALATTFAGVGALCACSLLLTKEPLPCASQADCTKHPGTVCDLARKECVLGTPSDGGEDALADAPGFDGSDPCLNPSKPLLVLRGEIKENLTIKCENDYRLVGRVVVTPPFAITIAAGTTIYGDPAIDPETGSPGTLVVPPGSRIVALGEKEKPIVFTSAKLIASPPQSAAAGDWGGIFILGEAPVNIPADGGVNRGVKQGLGNWGDFGGTKPNNDSGQLKYVRIEYAGGKLPGGGDGISLALAGVGDQTIIDHVQSRFSGDDCVEVTGGTVNLKHLACQYAYDDGIAFENGWTGKVQFLVVQGRPNVDNNSNGIQGRSGAAGAQPAQPISSPTIYNATFCGQNILPNPVRDQQQYGIRLTDLSQAKVFNSIFMGWEATVDLRGSYVPGAVAAGNIFLRNSIAFGNVARNVAYAETVTAGSSSNPEFDDDGAFDEVAWFLNPLHQNSQADPNIPKCFGGKAPRFAATGPIGTSPADAGDPHAATPPNDGFFDSSASYIGAFRDQADLWASGRWIVWDEQ